MRAPKPTTDERRRVPWFVVAIDDVVQTDGRGQRMARITLITLTPTAVAKLRKPVVGRGGLQSLLRRLQRCIVDDVLVITDAELLERIDRYRADYGDGGFQRRLGF
jgi:hypothetical protein